MFGLGDSATKETARRLLARVTEIETAYLGRPFVQAKDMIEADFPAERRFASHDQIGVSFDELPDFSFIVMDFVDQPSIILFGGGPYDGFMLQGFSRSGWHIDVAKPFAGPIGPKAKLLGDVLKRDHGATDPREKIRRFLRR